MLESNNQTVKMSMSSSVLALLESCVDSSNDWLSDSNSTVYAYLSIGLKHRR